MVWKWFQRGLMHGIGNRTLFGLRGAFTECNTYQWHSDLLPDANIPSSMA
jgi:hypothetical protein